MLLPVVLSENSWIGSFGRIYRYVGSERQEVTVKFDRDLYVRVGDPVYMKTEYGWKRIGQVISEQIDEVGDEVRTESVTIALFGDSPPVTKDCFVTLHETPGSFEWALKRLLPKEKRSSEYKDSILLKFVRADCF